jgi:hypothetical protein
MTDIWSGAGIDIAAGEGEWLYRVGEEVRGPLPFRTMVDKLLKGEIALKTLVAKEGGEFYPVVNVAAFSPHIPEAKKRAKERAAGKSRRVVLMILLLAVALLSGGGYIVWTEYEKAHARRLEKEHQAALALAKRREEAKRLGHTELVALVSLGTESDVKIHSAPRRPVAATNHHEIAGPTEEEVVSQCKLTQQDIFSTLSRSLGKINVCVEDEKQRNKEGLPPTLELDFIVLPDGRVSEFKLTDRHFRVGPMNNCMIKAFQTITFPKSNGANCPVTIPIKIGG